MIDQAQIDKDGNGILYNGIAKVERVEKVSGQKDVFLLEADYTLERKTQVLPKPGQFYMLRTKTSSGYFKRPISVYHAECLENPACSSEARQVRIQFLILQKGEGTKELCELKKDDQFLLRGPLGN